MNSVASGSAVSGSKVEAGVIVKAEKYVLFRYVTVFFSQSVYQLSVTVLQHVSNFGKVMEILSNLLFHD